MEKGEEERVIGIRIVVHQRAKSGGGKRKMEWQGHDNEMENLQMKGKYVLSNTISHISVSRERKDVGSKESKNQNKRQPI